MAAQQEPALRLSITGLEIRGYRSLRRVEWPKDGLGWGDKIPDIVLVGGANGSGKTTLLETLYGVVRYMIDARRTNVIDTHSSPPLLPRGAGLVRVDLADGAVTNRLVVSAEHLYTAPNHPPNTWSIRTDEREVPEIAPSMETLSLERARLMQELSAPSAAKLIYFPTDRSVTFPATQYKGPGKQASSEDTWYRYEASSDWQQSVEAILYDARWRDLNAKERGNAGSARNFAAFEATMRRFFGDTKRFHWDDEGVLHIQMADGTLHPLQALSSGEKQVLLFGAELYRRWTPGSLILLDEPELHLHDAWLSSLWGAICELQRERGGQVIITTQSNYLFGLGEPGSRVLLGAGL